MDMNRVNDEYNSQQRYALNVNITDAANAKVRGYQETLKRLQQKMQETGKDATISEEEKQQKRQEIQKQIAEVNRQIRAAQFEASREKIPGSNNAVKDQQEGKEEQRENSLLPDREQSEAASGEQNPGQLSAGQIAAVIISGNALEQARSQQSTVQSLEGRIRTLGGEIRMDQGRGKSVEQKQAEQEDLEQKVREIHEKTAKHLSDAKKKTEEISEEKQKREMKRKFIQSQAQAETPKFQIQI